MWTQQNLHPFYVDFATLSFLHDRCLIPCTYRALIMFYTSLIEIRDDGNMHCDHKEYI